MIDTVLAYPLHDWNEWKVTYVEKIRAIVVWDKLAGCEIGFKVADPETKLYLAQYDKGDWRDGNPITLEQKNNTTFAYVRVPCVQVEPNAFVLLDGTHRVQEIQPKFLVIDYLIVPKNKKKYITDLYNEEYLK